MYRAHRIALDLNNRQKTYMARAAGVARFAYNWALKEWKSMHEEWKADQTLPKPSQFILRKRLNAIKREQFPWMLEVTKNAPQMAIIHLGQAFGNFFAKRGSYPKFHRKGLHDSFTLTNDQIKIEGKRISIPKLGWVRMRESLRFSGKIMSATISRVAGRWYVSVSVDTPDSSYISKAENQGAIGVDLGISDLAVLSDGKRVSGPMAYRMLLHRLRRYSRSLSRKKRGSANWRKARLKLQKLHFRISSIRMDSLHKLTTTLVTLFELIGIEDLNVQGMMRNRHLSRSIADMGFSEFRRQLEYKAAMYGSIVVVADRFFASSKTCSSCGHKLTELPLSMREWTCPVCGIRHDRDVNAAINLREYAVSSHGVSLWKGRLWPLSHDDCGETILDEAGSQQQICSEMS